jgi:hypothetical protein
VKYPLYFLYSPEFLSQNLPTTLEDDWSSFGASSEGTIYATMIGIQAAGIECLFGSDFPRGSVIIAHPRGFPSRKPSDAWDNYLVCWQQDYMRCDYAHCHVVMNNDQTLSSALSKYDRYLFPGPRHRLHYLPEPSLIKRPDSVGSRFNAVGYLGSRKNLIAELQSPEWFDSLKAIGLSFSIRDAPNGRSCYTDLDAVLAVRPSGVMVEQKSPHKLWNAWRAGVPAILGPEPGFRDFRKSELDYIEVRTAEEALQALIRLRDNPDLRQAMIENGRRRIHECSVETIIGQWVDFIRGPLESYAMDWFEGPAWKRNLFGAVRTARIGLRKLRHSMEL